MMPRHVLIALACALAATARADGPPVTASDWGSIGLLQMPSARMSEAGEVSFTYSKTAPYSRFNFMLQPFDWLEAGFRYIDVANRLYGPTIAGGQSLKDKSIDVKFRVVPESRHVPQVAVGLRDIGGTGLFAGEYVVASKRFGDLDATLGMGWGYLGSSDTIGNPFRLLSDKFKDRAGASAQGGDLNTSAYFRGPAAFFGGLQYQTPHKPLLLKLEWDGNDYQSEPQANNQERDSPVNIGMVYRLNNGVDLHAGFERGNTAMVGLTLHTNLKQARPVPRLGEPAPEPLREMPPDTVLAEVDWPAFSQRLESQAGLVVQRLRLRERELLVEAEPVRYLDTAEAVSRAGHVAHNTLPEDIAWVTVAAEDHGLRSQDWTIDRGALLADARGEPDAGTVLQQSPPALLKADTLYVPEQQAFRAGVSPGFTQSVGGPDGFILYQFTADLEASWRPRRDFWVNGLTSLRVLDNYDDFQYTAPSNLPRVRTYIREYRTTSRLTLPVLKFNKTWQPTADIYAMAYGGLLESMFAGAGVEWLYRPHGARWALGADLNVVQQRDFEQDFGLRDYRTVTGHVSLYADTGIEGVLAKVHVGRYLAKDNGVTFDLSRRFHNGVEMGAYATFTDVSREDFGEGSFDKGIYLRIPYDLMLGRSTRKVANIGWSPLTRDGGARLERGEGLYELTRDRSADW